MASKLLIALAMTGLMLSAASTTAAPPDVIVKQNCASCHGVDGNSRDSAVPRLNGQVESYLSRRLMEFLDLPSQDPHAIGMANRMTNISDADQAPIAAYYAGQTATAAKPDAPHAASGMALFRNGDRYHAISACASCHGWNGEGGAIAPRLAGQHAVYLRQQLERMRLLLRADLTMFHNTRSMSDEQIRDLVAYLAND